MGDKETRDFEKNLKRTPKKGQSETEKKEMPDDTSRDDDFNCNHPIFNAISYENGQINRMSLNQMKQRCKELGLDTDGRREALKRRLKEFVKREKLIQAGLLEPQTRTNVDYFVVIDFEATCEEKNPLGYPHEIIEFPAVLVSSGYNGETKCSSSPEIIDVFHSFVRPVINPELSEFCKNLTGIEQSVVDKAETFPVVQSKFLKWMRHYSLGITKSYCIVTDGPFDMGRFLFLQTLHLSSPFPSYATYWTNLRKCFANFYKGDFYASLNTPTRLPGLQNMLNSLDLEFEGHPHSGLDDAKNIARVLVKMLRDGAQIRVNEGIANDCIDDFNRDKTRLVTVRSVPNRESKQVYYRQIKQVGLRATSECGSRITGTHAGNADENSEKFDLMKLFQALPT